MVNVVEGKRKLLNKLKIKLVTATSDGAKSSYNVHLDLTVSELVWIMNALDKEK